MKKKKKKLHKAKTSSENEGLFDEEMRRNEEIYEKNDRLMMIDETKIKSEGEDTMFSASIFEDEIGSAEWKGNSHEDGGWLFEDEKRGHTNSKVKDKGIGDKNAVVFKKKM